MLTFSCRLKPAARYANTVREMSGAEQLLTNPALITQPTRHSLKTANFVISLCLKLPEKLSRGLVALKR